MELFNSFIIHASSVIHKSSCYIISCIESIYLRLINVHYGGNGKFRGWCSVYRRPDTKITIGHSCTFNSSHYSNHIGLNHRCIIGTMSKGATIVIGNHVGVSSSTITAFDSITIGDNVRIGANCLIMDGDYHLNDPRISSPKPIEIGNNVWLGYGVVVMKGVTIGENSIIGVNSVVTKDIPANVVAAGSPCRIIRER